MAGPKDKKQPLEPAGATFDAPAAADPEPVVLDSVPPASDPPVRIIKPSRRYYTRCRVEGSAVVSDGKLYEPGTEDEFPDGDVLSLPDHLIPVE